MSIPDRKRDRKPTLSFRARLRRLDWSERWMLLEACATLAVASLAIAVLPFRRLAAMMTGAVGAARAPGEQDATVERARWAVLAASRRLPWRTVCFQQGLALHIMLRRRGLGSVLHYGVRQEAGKGVTAHVWIRLGGADILGGREAAGFACLATFPPLADGRPPAAGDRR